jgi:hypothetical protein
MGTRGPIPDREEALARPRSRKGGDQQEVTHGQMKSVVIPEPDPTWHPIATMLWESLAQSGQADFYQQSDWAFAYSLCEDLTRYKEPLTNRETGELYFKRSGQMLQAIYSAMERLLVTEGDRRRVRLELDKPEPEKTPASVIAIADYRQDLELDDEEEPDSGRTKPDPE